MVARLGGRDKEAPYDEPHRCMRLRTMPEIAERTSGRPGALHDRKTALASVRGRASCRLAYD